MKQHEKVLLDILGRALFGASVSIPPDTDMTALYEEARVQAVPILAMEALSAEEKETVSEETRARWKKTLLAQSAYNIQLLYEQQAVLHLLRESGIPCAVLKGSSVACHYPIPTHRVMGDMDILVPPDRQMEAVRLLQTAGYGEILAEEHHCHYTIAKDKLTVEMHREPNGIHMVTDEAIAEKLHAFFADALADVTWVGDIPILATDRQAVVLLIHKLEHFLDGGLGLRQLCDWSCFVQARLTPDEWNSLRPFLAECGLLEFAGVITRACCDHLHLPTEAAPWCMEYDRELAGEVMEAIVENGNFGRKDGDDAYGKRLFSDYESSNRLASLFRMLGKACRHHWPPCARHRIFMPVAPFVVGVKYLKMRMRGEHSAIHPVKLYRKAGPRQKLYQSLKPFQGEHS